MSKGNRTPDVPLKWKSLGATDRREADLFSWWGSYVLTEIRGLWLQPTFRYHRGSPQSFSGKWDTCVQRKYDCWIKCSGPEFCLPFVKIVNRPSNKPWISWKYLRIPSNVQDHIPGGRKYHNHRVWSKQSHILNISTKSKHRFNLDCLTKVKEGICLLCCSSIAKLAEVM